MGTKYCLCILFKKGSIKSKIMLLKAVWRKASEVYVLPYVVSVSGKQKKFYHRNLTSKWVKFQFHNNGSNFEIQTIINCFEASRNPKPKFLGSIFENQLAQYSNDNNSLKVRVEKKKKSDHLSLGGAELIKVRQEQLLHLLVKLAKVVDPNSN